MIIVGPNFPSAERDERNAKIIAKLREYTRRNTKTKEMAINALKREGLI